MRSSIQKWLWQIASLILAAGLLAMLLGRQDWGLLAGQMRGANFRLIATAGGMAVIYWSIRTARWRWMTALEGRRIGWTRAWVSMLAGLGLGLVTPLRSGEILRPMLVPRGARMRLAGWVVIERMFDLSAVLALSMLGLVYMAFSGLVLVSGAEVSPWLLIVCPLLLAGAIGIPLLVHYRPAGLWSALGRVLPGKARELAENRLQWRQFGVFFGVSVLAEVFDVLAIFLCLSAFGQIRLVEAAALAPVVVLHNLLPAAPGGFGLREGAAVLIFGLFGFSEGPVLAAYLSSALIVLLIPASAGVAAAWIAGLAASMPAD